MHIKKQVLCLFNSCRTTPKERSALRLLSGTEHCSPGALYSGNGKLIREQAGINSFPKALCRVC